MSDRAKRFARSVQEELSALLRHVKDPRVSDAGLVTITHVQCSDDLSTARVLVTVHGGDGEALVKGLTSARPFLSRELGRALRAKKVPELRFVLDETDDRADRVEALLREIAGERKPE
jgi:ribosome-binding factor A